FGGTGDLATRKLLPALFRLWEQKRLENCLIVGVGRRCKNLDDYLAYLREHVHVPADHAALWTKFTASIAYHQGEIDTSDDFQSLRQTLMKVEGERHLPGNRLFYCAVSPHLFAAIAKGLAAVELLSRKPQSDDRWSRLIVEKPFGHDLQSAQ